MPCRSGSLDPLLTSLLPVLGLLPDAIPPDVLGLLGVPEPPPVVLELVSEPPALGLVEVPPEALGLDELLPGSVLLLPPDVEPGIDPVVLPPVLGDAAGV